MISPGDWGRAGSGGRFDESTKRNRRETASRYLRPLALLVLSGFVAACDARTHSSGTTTAAVTSSSVVQPSQISFLGSFVVGAGNPQDPPCSQQAFSLGAIAYRASDDSLFVNSHDHDPMCVGHFGPIPTDLSGTATIPVMERFWGRVPRDRRYDAPSKMKLHGLQWDESRQRLCATETIWYNVSNHDSLDAACIHENGAVDGPWELGSNNLIAGPIAQEPNGRYLIGLTGVPGAANANFGPGAFEVDFAAPSPALMLMTHRYSPPATDTREEMSNGLPWLTSMPAMGSAVADGTLLWAVEEGDVEFYGTGCAANAAGRASFEKKYGFRPRSCSDGYHHDRYHPTLYLYSLGDLEAVRAGQKLPSDVHPYTYLPLEPNVPVQSFLGELDVDTAGRRIFLASPIQREGVRIYVYAY
jgi:hypothetical protein